MTAVIIAPVYFFVSARLPGEPPQVAAPTLLPLDDLRQSALHVPNYRDAVPVLLYHDVSHRSGSMTPEGFAAQMNLLKQEGFHTVTISEVNAFLHGSSLPSRAVAVAFDDSLGSLWRNVDPILAREGFTATVFAAPLHVGTDLPYRLSRADVARMVLSKRWDFEARTVPSIAGLNLDRMLASFGPLQTPPPVAFLYAPNRPAQQEVASRFSLSFQKQHGPVHFISRLDTPFQRLSVFAIKAKVSALQLLGALAEAVPMKPDVARPFAVPRSWAYEGGSYAQLSRGMKFGSFELRSRHVKHWVAAYLSPARTMSWRNYSASVSFRKLGSSGAGSDASLLLGQPVTLILTASPSELTILNREHKILRQIRWVARDQHSVGVRLDHDRAYIVADGRTVVVLSIIIQGGIGLGGWREHPGSPNPIASNLIVSGS